MSPHRNCLSGRDATGYLSFNLQTYFCYDLRIPGLFYETIIPSFNDTVCFSLKLRIVRFFPHTQIQLTSNFVLHHRRPDFQRMCGPE